jgi:sterol desaturase/sphingolipid hydroxylase (fatty acid hydroxylase superfamily)
MLIMALMCFKYYHLTVAEVLGWTALGSAIYTFIEYWFHRVILHRWLEAAHRNHHNKPRNLRIITTPLIPVQAYGLIVMVLAVFVLGRRIAYGINCGIAIGQITMDTVHVLFHSRFRPWYLESARSYHLYHHYTDDEEGHGLTTSFWDMVFCTLPKSWAYYNRYPYMRYLQLPFPLLSFIVVGLLANDSTKHSTAIAKPDDEGGLKSHGSIRSNWIAFVWVITLMSFFLIELAPTAEAFSSSM